MRMPGTYTRNTHTRNSHRCFKHHCAYSKHTSVFACNTHVCMLETHICFKQVCLKQMCVCLKHACSNKCTCVFCLKHKYFSSKHACMKCKHIMCVLDTHMCDFSKHKSCKRLCFDRRPASAISTRVHSYMFNRNTSNRTAMFESIGSTHARTRNTHVYMRNTCVSTQRAHAYLSIVGKRAGEPSAHTCVGVEHIDVYFNHAPVPVQHTAAIETWYARIMCTRSIHMCVRIHVRT